MAGQGWAAGDLLKERSRFSPPQAKEADPRAGWREGMWGRLPGLGQVPFLLSTHWQSPSAKGPQGIRSCQLLGGIQGHGRGAAEMPVSRSLPTWRHSRLHLRWETVFYLP